MHELSYNLFHIGAYCAIGTAYHGRCKNNEIRISILFRLKVSMKKSKFGSISDISRFC